MNKKMKALLLSCSIILLCICTLMGISYALFTDSASVKNHLKAGTLDATLTRTSLKYAVLNDAGYMTEKTLGAHDFTGMTEKNVFGLDTTDLYIAPGSYFEAELALANADVDGHVAFDYVITVELTSAVNPLAEQMQITVTFPNGTKVVQMMDENDGKITFNSVHAVEAGQTHNFTVRVDFTHDASNNNAKSNELTFDLSVACTQALD